jgi:hypothetical protein
MDTVQFSSGVAAQIESVSERLVLAIDLGFSKSSKSCGIAWRDGTGQPHSEGLRFGECINKIVALLRGHSTAVLIIEAPLSGLFSSAGNPVERGDFEKKDPSAATGTTRYWYSGPGAATCLAVVFFLRKLIAEVEKLPEAERPSEIALYEGFITFKREATQHVSDAELLLNCFLGKQPRLVIEVKAADDQALIAITEVVAGSATAIVAPAIIAPSNVRAAASGRTGRLRSYALL